MAKIYGIKNEGPHIVQKLPTKPIWTSADEGRVIYVQDEHKLYYGTSTGWSVGLGYSGHSGESGLSGIDGVSGYSGHSGYSGATPSGYSGYSGINAYFGSTGVGNSAYFQLPNGLIMNFGYYNDTDIFAGTTAFSGWYGSPHDWPGYVGTDVSEGYDGDWTGKYYRQPGQKIYTIAFTKPFTSYLLYAEANLVTNENVTKAKTDTWSVNVLDSKFFGNGLTHLDLIFIKASVQMQVEDVNDWHKTLNAITRYNGFYWLAIGF